jgi:hypothetical protein
VIWRFWFRSLLSSFKAMVFYDWRTTSVGEGVLLFCLLGKKRKTTCQYKFRSCTCTIPVVNWIQVQWAGNF